MVSKTQLFALLASAVAATPVLPPSPTNFTLIAIHSGDQKIHQRPIQANDGQLWIGKPTTGTTESKAPGVEAGSTTAYFTSGGQLWLDAAVPGGQTVYVNDVGILQYTVAGTKGVVPAGGVATGFSWAPAANGAGSALITPDPLYACPSGGADTDTFYLVSSSKQVDLSCVNISADGFEYTGTGTPYEYN